MSFLFLAALSDLALCLHSASILRLADNKKSSVKNLKLAREWYKNNEWELLKSALSFLIHTQEDKQAVVTTFKKSLSQQTTSKIMTIAEQLIEEGLQKGRQEGRQEGVRALLEKQLIRRFPSDGKRFFHLINDADSDTLSMWVERLMDAKTIEEVFIY
ncbi:MAG: hypothetical protein ACH346_02055 [Chthoniobacterales bacterium]